MVVHSAAPAALERGMRTCTTAETLPIEAGDPEWVADLFDTLRAGDLDAVIDELDEVVRIMRKAAKARRMLATVDQRLLCEGYAVAERRRSGS
jgi:hypothetical protein